MYNFKTLKCSNCSTVILNLPEAEVKKIDGATLQCDCCDHLSILSGSQLVKSFSVSNQ